MDQYKIAEHGDLLEQQAASFIQQKFPHYERVWCRFRTMVTPHSVLW